MRTGRHLRRRAFAASLAVLWLLAVEVLPNLHLATHRDDHTHAADGSIVPHAHGEHHAHDAAHVHVDAHGHATTHTHGAHRHADLTRAYVSCADLDALGIDHEHFEIADGVDYFEPAHGEDDHALAADDLEGTEDELVVARAASSHAPARHGDAGELAIDHALPEGHAALGVAHRALALHAPPPPLLAPFVTPQVTSWRVTAPDDQVESAERAGPRARGPPAG